MGWLRVEWWGGGVVGWWSGGGWRVERWSSGVVEWWKLIQYSIQKNVEIVKDGRVSSLIGGVFSDNE